MVLSNWITDIAARPDTTELGGEYRYFCALQDANYNVMGIVTSGSWGTRLVERYEYTPYGQRTVYSHGYVQGDVNADGHVNNTDLDAVLGSWNTIVTTPNPAEISGDGYIGLDDMMVVLGNWNAGIPTSNNYDPLVTHPRLNSARFTSNGEAGMGSALCEVGHQGLFHDEEFGSSGGLIHNRARTLHPQLGRFMQRDPLGYVDGMNTYEYLKNNAFVHFDPKGTMVFGPSDLVPGGSSPCVTVNIWNPNYTYGSDFAVGHASLNGGTFYASFWPTDPTHSGWSHTQMSDVREYGRPPDETIEICCLNVEAMRQEFERLKSETNKTCNFDLLGSNCSSIVGQLLKKGSQEPGDKPTCCADELAVYSSPFDSADGPSGLDRPASARTLATRLKYSNCAKGTWSCEKLDGIYPEN